MVNFDGHFKVSHIFQSEQFTFSGDFEKVKNPNDLEKQLTQLTKEILADKSMLLLNKGLKGKDISEIDFQFDAAGQVKIKFKTTLGEVAECEVNESKDKLLTLVNRLAIPSLLPSKIETQKELPVLFKKLHSEETRPLSTARRFLNAIGKYFTFNRYIKQPVINLIENKIKNLQPDQLKELYLNRRDLFQEIEVVVSQQSGYQYLTKEELSDCVNKLFVEGINQRLKSSNQTPWDKDTIKHLDILEVFTQAKEGLISTQQFEEKVSKMAPLDVPLKLLAEFPVTQENKDALSNIWKNQLGNLFVKGHLDQVYSEKNVADLIKQVEYANQYVDMRSQLPSLFVTDPEMKDILSDMDNKRQFEDIKTFLFERSAFADSKTSLAFISKQIDSVASLKEAHLILDEKLGFANTKLLEVLQAAKKLKTLDELKGYLGKKVAEFKALPLELTDQMLIKEKAMYTEHVLPLVQKEIDDFVRRRDDGTFSTNTDWIFTNTVNLLTFPQRIDNMGREVTKRLDSTISGPAADRKMFSKEKIEQLLISEIERRLVFNHQLSSSQITALNRSRAANKTSDAQTDSLYNILYSDTVIEEIGKAESSSPLISSSELADLASLQKMIKTKFDVQVLDPQVKSNLKRLIENQKGESLTDREKFKILKKIDSETLYSLSLSEKNKLIQIIQNTDPSNRLIMHDKQKLLEHISSKAGDSFTAEEKTKVKEMIMKAAKDPTFKKRTKILLGEDLGFSIDFYISSFPKFIQSAIKKHFGEVREFPELGDYKKPYGLGDESLELVASVASKIPKMEQYEKVVSKAEKLLEKTMSQQPLTKDDKLTLKEMGTLSDLMRIHRDRILDKVGDKRSMDILASMGLFDEDPKLKAFNDIFERGQFVFETMESKMRSNLANHYKDGDILGYSGNKKKLWFGSLHGEAYYTTLVTNSPLNHGGKIYKGEKGDKVLISHVVNEYTTEDFDTYQLLISDVWELDVAPLFDSDMQQTLKELYGENWKEIVNQKYQEIERGIHSNVEKHFKKIENDAQIRARAGFADYAPVLKMFTPLVQDHIGQTVQDFNKIHEKFLEGKDADEVQICSQFVTESTIASMIELNRFLSKEIANKVYNTSEGQKLKDSIRDMLKGGTQPSQDVMDYIDGVRHFGSQADRAVTEKAEKGLRSLLQLRGVKKGEVNRLIRTLNNEIFDLPYDRRERLEGVHPGRMVKLLEKRNCVKKKEYPPEVLQFIQAP